MTRTLIIFAVMAVAILTAILMMAYPNFARADGVYGIHHRSYVNRIVYRRKIRNYRHPEINLDDIDDDWRRNNKDCKPKTRGLGTQWIGEEGAMEAARKDWMERTRYDFGEKYLDMNNAENFLARCGRVSIGQVAGQVTYRCEIFANPCKSELTKIEGQK